MSRLTLLHLSWLVLFATFVVPADRTPAQDSLITTVRVPNVHFTTEGEGQFTFDYSLPEPVSLDQVSLVHWDSLRFEIRRGMATGWYGSKVDLVLLRGDQTVVTAPFTTNSWAPPSYDSFAFVDRGSFVLSGRTEEVTAIRLLVTTPTPLFSGNGVLSANSDTSVNAIAEDDTLTLRFIRGRFSPAGNHEIRRARIPATSWTEGLGAWSEHYFDDPVPARSLRFIDHTYLNARFGAACGGMTESQLILDDQEPGPTFLALDDAYSPSRGEPRRDSSSNTHSLELVEDTQAELADRKIIGWRWRSNSYQGCRMKVVESSITLRFFYDCEECPGLEMPSVFRRGDCNGDGEVDVSDPVCIINWLFAGQADPGCVAATNTDGDDAAKITDATYLLHHLFAGGPAPVVPFPDCGPATLPADAELGCESPPECQ